MLLYAVEIMNKKEEVYEDDFNHLHMPLFFIEYKSICKDLIWELVSIRLLCI